MNFRSRISFQLLPPLLIMHSPLLPFSPLSAFGSPSSSWFRNNRFWMIAYEELQFGSIIAKKQLYCIQVYSLSFLLDQFWSWNRTAGQLLCPGTQNGFNVAMHNSVWLRQVLQVSFIYFSILYNISATFPWGSTNSANNPISQLIVSIQFS